MTSKQIKTSKKEDSATWLRECAFQLAVLNERNAELDEYNAKADEADAERRTKNNDGLSALLNKAMDTLARLGAPFEPPSFVAAPTREH